MVGAQESDCPGSNTDVLVRFLIAMTQYLTPTTYRRRGLIWRFSSLAVPGRSIMIKVHGEESTCAWQPGSSKTMRS